MSACLSVHVQGKGLASRGNSTYRRSLVVEKTALRASPALLPLMSTLYVCCSNRSLAMLVSSSTIRLPFCPHRHSLRASPGSVFTAHSAASVPKSFFHRHVLPVCKATVCLSRQLKSSKFQKQSNQHSQAFYPHKPSPCLRSVSRTLSPGQYPFARGSYCRHATQSLLLWQSDSTSPLCCPLPS